MKLKPTYLFGKKVGTVIKPHISFYFKHNHSLFIDMLSMNLEIKNCSTKLVHCTATSPFSYKNKFIYLTMNLKVRKTVKE